jgi:hypothetical protein
LFRRRELDADMDEELRSHIELRTQANIEPGMTPEKAQLAALGNLDGENPSRKFAVTSEASLGWRISPTTSATVLGNCANTSALPLWPR